MRWPKRRYVTPDSISNPEFLNPGWLTSRLSEQGHLPSGEVLRITPGQSFESTAAFLTPLTVTYSHDAPASAPHQLIVKIYREDWYGGGLAEAVFYQEFVAAMPAAPVVTCYDVTIVPEHYYCRFVFQDISKSHAPPAGTPSQAQLEEIVDGLLQFHTKWWDHPRISRSDFFGKAGGPLRMTHATKESTFLTYCQHIAMGFRDFADDLGDELPGEWRQLCERAIAAWPSLFLNRVSSGKALTFIHGDFGLWNIYLPHDSKTHRLCFLDWETYKRSIGVYDLAYMLITADYSGDLNTRNRMEGQLLRRYHDGLLAQGIAEYDWDDCRYDYRLSVIANLFPPVGWQRLSSLQAAITAFHEWGCAELLD